MFLKWPPRSTLASDLFWWVRLNIFNYHPKPSIFFLIPTNFWPFFQIPVFDVRPVLHHYHPPLFTKKITKNDFKKNRFQNGSMKMFNVHCQMVGNIISILIIAQQGCILYESDQYSFEHLALRRHEAKTCLKMLVFWFLVPEGTLGSTLSLGRSVGLSGNASVKQRQFPAHHRSKGSINF